MHQLQQQQRGSLVFELPEVFSHSLCYVALLMILLALLLLQLFLVICGRELCEVTEPILLFFSFSIDDIWENRKLPLYSKAAESLKIKGVNCQIKV